MTLYESRYIAAIHDKNPLDYQGWEIRVEEVGHNPAHTGGTDYRNSRHTPIVRFQNGWSPNGTIPLPEHYADFATRCANFVRNSQGCSVWIIGNECNHSSEQPHGQPITPDLYARCYDMCWQAIHELPGHENDQVIVGAIAPYNNQTKYPGNANGDWALYLEHILTRCRYVDGVALHAYSSNQQPNIIISDAKMGPPFGHLSSEFRTYRDQMNAIPESLYGKPVYLTEMNPGARGTPWQNANTGWVRAAYDEIARWNAQHYGREIRCAALYCWDRRGDGMWIQDKPGVLDDFKAAAARGLEWAHEPPVDPPGPEPPDPPAPAECQFSEAVVRRVVREEMAGLYSELREAMVEEIRQALNNTMWLAKIKE